MQSAWEAPGGNGGASSQMNAPSSKASRAGSSAILWFSMWLCVGGLFSAMAWDGWQRAAPLILWVLWFLPIMIVLPGVAADRLRSVTWLSFISLIYFVMATLRIFAEPASIRAQLELFAVIGVFNCSMFYVRQRARELRQFKQSDGMS
ncbi:MAG: DUF2069 domain-containing protein [Pseudomonadota bacterium]